ncbi:uncharacterized protein LOC134206079 [Armigeres subalbatus]|uniref:uncharacterized protein LOC134206079 n=1 Tax=Armigeres subalbatus TaxID=124917 RepID=UPI002ED0D2C1
MEEEDILAEMTRDGVTRVQRITKNEGGQRVNTPALILTFCKTTYPDFLKVGPLHVAKGPYFPNPMLCYSCFNYGHIQARCPGPQRCHNCSGEPHGEECGNYAQAASRQNEFEKRLKELEHAMKSKDSGIAKLRNGSKQKDEKMKIMSNIIEQLKQQATRQGKSHRDRSDSREKQVPTHSIPGPVTRSRNNSPAVQEAKRSRTLKCN